MREFICLILSVLSIVLGFIFGISSHTNLAFIFFLGGIVGFGVIFMQQK